MTRVAIYCRRSQDDGDTTRSLPEQEEACRRFSATIGEVVRVEKENASASGDTRRDRPRFMALVESAQRGDYDVLLTLDQSRFSRVDVPEYFHWVFLLREAGVHVRHVHGDLSALGEHAPVLAAVQQTAAREHSVSTARRVAMGQVAAARAGFWPGGAVPLGYRLERPDGWCPGDKRQARLVIVEGEARLVRMIYEWRVELGLGYETLARRLNDAGHRTKSGGPWNHTGVRHLLQNSIYVGRGVRAASRPRGRRPKFYRGSDAGPVRKEQPSAGYSFNSPVIVPQELWDRAQAITAGLRDEFGARPIGISNRSGLLSGLLSCGVCGGSAVAAEGSTRGNRRLAYVVCSARTHGAGEEKCRFVRCNRDRLVAAVLRHVREVAVGLDPDAMLAELRRGQPKRPVVDVRALEVRRRRLAERRRELVLSDDDFTRDAVKILADEDARLARQIREAAAPRAEEADTEAMLRAAVEAARRLEAPDTDEGRDALRAVMRAFLQDVTVLPGKLRSKVKPVKLTIYTPKGMAAVIGAPSSPT